MALLMLAPSIIVLGVFVFYPLGKAVWLGHLSCDATGQRCVERAGWQQYLDVLQSDQFLNALGNTFLLALLTVPAGVFAGIGLAVLADKYLRGIGIFRTIFSSTIATSVAVASLIWFVLLQPQVGLLSDLFSGIFPALKNPANFHKAVGFTPDEWHYAFTNTLSREESDAAHARYAIPAPGNWVWAYGLLANYQPGRQATWVDYSLDRAALLFIGGGEDHIMPPAVNKSNAKHWGKSPALTEYHEFEGRDHWT
jgi:ABC-type sugar transport system permease subunit